MRPTPALTAALCALLALIAPAPAAAASADARYTLSLRGIDAAGMTLAGREEGDRYAVSARVRGTGLVRLLTNLQYDATVQGRFGRGGWSPGRYREQDDDDAVEITWGSTVTSVRTPPRDRPRDVDPAAQRGAVDPLTALWATLRPQPAASACALSLEVYDGSRTGRFRLGSPRAEGDGLRCAGSFRRTGGYSDDELSEGREFGFTVHYEPAGGGLVRGSRVRMDTTYGPAEIRLR
jgi:hypothetical protein